MLRAACLDPDRAAAAWRRWSADHTIDSASSRSVDLLPAVSANVDADVLGDDAGRLRGLRRRVWADNQLALSTLADAAALLTARGCEPVVVKGAALATTVFSEPGTRPMADVDLLIGADRFAEARQTFLEAGWHRIDPVDGPFFHALAVMDDRGRAVDVHKWVVFPRFSPIPERSWLARSVPHHVGRQALRRLASSDELVLATLHGLLTNSASASRWPLDVVRLTQTAARADSDFWDQVVTSAQEIHAGPVVHDALAMCRAELGADVPVEVLSALAAGPIDRGLAQHWALSRRGIALEWRIRRYRRLERAEGRKPTVKGYVAPRVHAVRSRGFTRVIAGRLHHYQRRATDRIHR